LYYQKGLDIALPALTRWAEQGGQTIVLGTGDPDLERQYLDLAARAPTRIAFALKFNGQVANRIYGGAEFLLMPSRYEPCGLSQMIAMRYGCIPVVRAVGGLRDTVRDVALGRGTGFVFSELSPEAITAALQRARTLFAQPRRWQALQRRAMRQDFSWRKSAHAYMAAYRQAIAFHHSTHD
jgi:starch synthase